MRVRQREIEKSVELFDRTGRISKRDQDYSNKLYFKRLFYRLLIQLALYLHFETRRECLQVTPLDMPSFADALNRIGFFFVLTVFQA